MSDVPVRKVTLSLPVETIERLERITKAQNASFDNNASRMINAGIDWTLTRWPLHGRAVDDGLDRAVEALATVVRNRRALVADAIRTAAAERRVHVGDHAEQIASAAINAILDFSEDAA